MLNRILHFFLANKLLAILLLVFLLAWGLRASPFEWGSLGLPRDPVAVDAIPNLGENQQIVYTEWAGRSPQDVEDQITYPLTTALLGVPGVKEVRSHSNFGFSSIYLIFEEGTDFYWARSRILEKLNALPAGTLPDGVQPSLGPDATALGQVFWYTLEGRDSSGAVTGGWDLQELRTIQDYYVKYGLATVEGVAEVASIGGHVKEYQVRLRPGALQNYDISLAQVAQAVRESNRDVGARTLELNRAEYLIRGLGSIKHLADLRQAVILERANQPIRIQDVARVQYGPAERRGILDKEGAEAVGGVVVVRHGANPMQVIQRVKQKIRQLSPGLPQKTLADGRTSQLKIVPFYDRSTLIQETLGTLSHALTLEMLITVLVVIVMVLHLRASLLIAGLLPLAVLITFIVMMYLDITANIVALAGIAIAIGTMVDLGIILSENIVRHMRFAPAWRSTTQTVYEATREVSGAVLTAVATTVVSFLPVFALQGEEGRMFTPLAYTKTFAIVAAAVVALLLLPAMAALLFRVRLRERWLRWLAHGLLVLLGLVVLGPYPWAGLTLLALGGLGLVRMRSADRWQRYLGFAEIGVIALTVAYLLAREWLPLGAGAGFAAQYSFVLLLAGGLLGGFGLFIRYYERLLRWFLAHKTLFLLIPSALLLLGVTIWLGFGSVFGFVRERANAAGWQVQQTPVWQTLTAAFPGLGQEFMPDLEEGSYLLMPTTLPHAGITQNKQYLQMLDRAVADIPEVTTVVGKAGRVNSALDPAPLSMFENVIQYKSEYKTDSTGRRLRFRVDEAGEFVRDSSGALMPDPDGRFYRQWREQVQSEADIWRAIQRAADLPGLTGAPKLQPIETRLVMLQTGMRAPMGIKVRGPELATVEQFGIQLEQRLKQIPELAAGSVYAERAAGKPYLHLQLDRQALSRYGLSVQAVQEYINIAIGGKTLTETVEGRQRYGVNVRYPREYRDSPEALRQIRITTPSGESLPLGQVVTIEYEAGPKVIKSEGTFPVSYVTFASKSGVSEIRAADSVQQAVAQAISAGDLSVPSGVSYELAGNYQSHQRATQRLSIVIPVSLAVIFLLLYFQFRSAAMALMVFAGIAVAFAGGFIMLGLYNVAGFLDFTFLGANMQEVFAVGDMNLSVAVWVGFIALFGIATDDGVVMATYLRQSFDRNQPTSRAGLRQAVVEAGRARVRPCLMTTATTLLALLPILTSQGKGSNIMQPMALPAFGGMAIELITLFVVPVLFAAWQEHRLQRHTPGASYPVTDPSHD